MLWKHLNDIIALVIAIGVSVSIVMLVYGDFTHNGHVTGEEATLISTVLGGAIGALAARIGNTNNHQ